jgi:hypothetical protein
MNRPFIVQDPAPTASGPTRLPINSENLSAVRVAPSANNTGIPGFGRQPYHWPS